MVIAAFSIVMLVFQWRQSMRGANRRALANLKRPDSNQGVAGVRPSKGKVLI